MHHSHKWTFLLSAVAVIVALSGGFMCGERVGHRTTPLAPPVLEAVVPATPAKQTGGVSLELRDVSAKMPNATGTLTIVDPVYCFDGIRGRTPEGRAVLLTTPGVRILPLDLGKGSETVQGTATYKGVATLKTPGGTLVMDWYE